MNFAPSRRRIVDLTLSISNNLPMYHGTPQPHTIHWDDLKTIGYNSELVAMSTHTGTHIDAPYHFYSKGKKLNKIPTSRLVRKALLVKTIKKREQNISASEIETLEQNIGKIAPDSTIIFQTDWSQMHNTRYYEKSPGLEPDTARLLARRRINMVGLDAPSIDVGSSKSFVAHNTFARSDIIVIESLCNLSKIRKSVFEFAALPLKIDGVSGAPVRAIAIC